MTDPSLLDTVVAYALLILNAAQWHILLLILIVTSVTTESVKRLLPANVRKYQKARIIYASSLLLGIAATVAGYFVATKVQPLWFWLVVGVVTGPVSNFLYRVTVPLFFRFVEWKFPALARRKAERS